MQNNKNGKQISNITNDHYKAIIEILFPPYIFFTYYQKYVVFTHEQLLGALCILQPF